MDMKNENPRKLLGSREINPILEFYFELNHLKQLFRRGWLLRGISQEKCETIADHLFGASILTLFIAEAYYPHFNIGKLLRMTLIHELGEIYVGDITPKDHIPKNLHYDYEMKAVLKIFSKLPNGSAYSALWKEYEEESSEEARFIRQVDILEAYFQSVVYQLQYPTSFNENSVPDNLRFLPWTKKRIRDKKLLALLTEAMNLIPPQQM